MSGIEVTPGQTSPHLMQVAFIVDDAEAAAKAWIATTGIGPFFMVPHIQLTEMTYRGEPGEGLDFSVALAQSGGMQVELIQQHCDRPSAYRDTIARGTQGFHHFCIYTDDYDVTRQRYVDQGFIAAIDSKFGEMRFCYVDTSASLGCMIEIIEHDETETEAFTRIAQAAVDWDGVTDPIRPLFA